MYNALHGDSTSSTGTKKLRIGIVGLGDRGKWTLSLLLKMEDVAITAVCDLYGDRVGEGIKMVVDAEKPEPAGFTDYRRAVDCDHVDCMITPASWTCHADVLIASMKAGKPAATEVGGAASVQECWDLVHAFEEAGIPCMMLENCCYGREELALLNMVRQGALGELIHCQGGYEHDLREEVACGAETRHYRIHQYKNRNGDVYPTHALGPIAKMLDINRGNRFLSISSVASKTRGVNLWAKEHLGSDHPSARALFALGDVVTTMIRCARGETIVLIHDTSLPRPYSRGLRIQGTKGLYMEDKYSVYMEGLSPHDQWEPFSQYIGRYEHALWKDSSLLEKAEGHGGIDYLVLRAFIESAAAGRQMPIDAYDTATWMAVTALSEQSAALGGMPVAFPDFTNGKWINRTRMESGTYSL